MRPVSGRAMNGFAHDGGRRDRSRTGCGGRLVDAVVAVGRTGWRGIGWAGAAGMRAALCLTLGRAERHADDDERQEYRHAGCGDGGPAHTVIVAFWAVGILER
jgi:hypothetical protein